MGELADHQVRMGRIEGRAVKGGTMLGGIIGIIMGIVLLIWSLTESSEFDGTKLDCSEDNPCDLDDEKCVDGKCHSYGKTHPMMALGAIVCILGSIFAIWYGNSFNDYVHRGRQEALDAAYWAGRNGF